MEGDCVDTIICGESVGDAIIIMIEPPWTRRSMIVFCGLLAKVVVVSLGTPEIVTIRCASMVTVKG